MSIPEQVQRLFREAETLTAQGRGHVQLHRQLHAQRQQDMETLHTLVTTLLGDPTTSPLQGAAASGLYAAHHRQMARARFMLSHHDQHLQQLSGWLDEFEGLYQQYRPLILGAMGLIPGPIWDFLANHVAIPSLADVVLYGDGMMPNLQAVWDGLAGEAVSFLENMGSDFIQGVGNFLGSVFWTGTSTFGMTGGSSGPSATQVHQQVSSSLSTPSSSLTSFASHTKAQHQKVQKEYYGGCGNCCQSEHDYTLPPNPPASALTLSQQQLTQRAQQINQALDLIAPPNYAQYEQYIAPLLAGLTPADIAALENIYSQKYHADVLFDIMYVFGDNTTVQYLVTQIFSPSSIQPAPLATQSGPTPRFIMKPPLDPAVVAQSPGPSSYAYFQFSTGNASGNTPLNYSYTILGPDGKPILHEPSMDPSRPIQLPLNAPGAYTIVVCVYNSDQSDTPQIYTYTQIVEPPDEGALQALRNQLLPPLDPQVYLTILQGQVQQLQQIKNPSQQQQDYLKQLQEQINNIQQYLMPDNNGGNDPSKTGPIPISAVFVDGQSSQSLPLLIYAVQTSDSKWEIVDLTDPEHPGHYDPSSTLDGAWQSFMQNNHYPDGQIAAAPPQRPYGYTGPFPAPSQPWNQRNDQKGWVQNLTNFFSGTSLALLVLGIGLQFIPGVDVLGDIALAGAAVSGAAAGGLDLYSLARYSRVDPHDPEVQLDVLSIAGALALGTGAVIKPLTETGSAVLISTGKAAYTGATVILAQNYYTQIQQIQNQTGVSSDQKQDEISQVLQSALANGGLMVLGVVGAGLRNIPASSGDWSPVCDELSLRLGLLPDTSEIPANVWSDPDLRQAMLGYLGIGSSGDPQQVLAELNVDAQGGKYAAQLARMSQDFAKWHNEYDKLPDDVKQSTTFAMYVLEDRTGGPLSLTRYETARINQTVADAQAINAQLQAKGKPPKYNPQLLAAIANGQDLEVSVDAAGNPVITVKKGIQLQAALINEGYNLDDLQAKWEDYVNGRTKGPLKDRLTSPTFGAYLTKVGVSVQLGASAKIPLNVYLKNFKTMSVQDLQLALLGDAEPNLKWAWSDDEFLASKHPNAVRDLIQKILNQDLLGSKATGATTVGDARGALMDKFNEQLGSGLANLYATGQISMKDVAEVFSIMNPANRGSVGEWFFYTLVNSPTKVSVRHVRSFGIEPADITAILGDPRYQGKITAATAADLTPGTVYPDETDDNQPPDGVDLKTFTTASIDQAQLLKYGQLIRTGQLQHMSYVFLPGDPAEGTAYSAAARAWNTISKYQLTGQVDVYYIDENGTMWHLDPESGAAEKVPNNNFGAVFTPSPGH
jgi:hypothetical protein